MKNKTLQEYNDWFKQAMKQFKKTYRKTPKKRSKAQTDNLRGIVLRKVDKTLPMPMPVN